MNSILQLTSFDLDSTSVAGGFKGTGKLFRKLFGNSYSHDFHIGGCKFACSKCSVNDGNELVVANSFILCVVT